MTSTPAKLNTARRMRQVDPPESYAVIARELGLSKTTVRRHLTEPPGHNQATGESR